MRGLGWKCDVSQPQAWWKEAGTPKETGRNEGQRTGNAGSRCLLCVGLDTWDCPPPHNQSRFGQATLEAALSVCAAGANLVGTSALPGLVSRGMI